MQLRPLNPLELCISQFLETEVASQRCHMELLGDKLKKYIIFKDHHLAHSIRIMAYNKKYPPTVCYMKLWITRLCYMQ